MQFLITIKYFNPRLQIGLEDIRNAWFFPGNENPLKLKTIIHQVSDNADAPGE